MAGGGAAFGLVVDRPLGVALEWNQKSLLDPDLPPGPIGTTMGALKACNVIDCQAPRFVTTGATYRCFWTRLSAGVVVNGRFILSPEGGTLGWDAIPVLPRGLSTSGPETFSGMFICVRASLNDNMRCALNVLNWMVWWMASSTLAIGSGSNKLLPVVCFPESGQC